MSNWPNLPGAMTDIVFRLAIPGVGPDAWPAPTSNARPAAGPWLWAGIGAVGTELPRPSAIAARAVLGSLATRFGPAPRCNARPAAGPWVWAGIGAVGTELPRPSPVPARTVLGLLSACFGLAQPCAKPWKSAACHGSIRIMILTGMSALRCAAITREMPPARCVTQCAGLICAPEGGRV